MMVFVITVLKGIRISRLVGTGSKSQRIAEDI